MFYFKNRITDNSYSRSKYQSTNKHVPIKHQQMSFVSNGGKFKLYTVPKGLHFSMPTQPRFSFEHMINAFKNRYVTS
jgi:hypothetical protein